MRFSAVLVSFLLFFGVASAFGAEKKTILVGTQPVNVGTSYLDDKGHLTGYEVEVLREINRRLPEYKFEFKTMDFGTLFIELSAKKLDVITSNIQWSPDREKKYLLTKEIFYATPYRLTVKGNDDKIKTFEDLKGKKIALLGTGAQAKVLADFVAARKLDVEIVPGKSNTEIINLLFSNRVDALFLPEHQALVFKKYRGFDLKTVDKGVIADYMTPEKAGARFALDKGNEVLRDRLDWALREIRKDGTLRKLSLEWFDKDLTVYNPN
ncbi:MAG: transporter substrate-binding domain-containing protein [Desulfovibrio sp.]|nr:transporter substrate-binding domain-containing protein [Desulfovibrio sp.]